MIVTEVRIKLAPNRRTKLLAFAEVVLDNVWVIRDLKIIEGCAPFVALPSRKITDRCPKCSLNNPVSAKFCSDCGMELAEDRAMRNADGDPILYADVVHPINGEARAQLEKAVLAEYWRAKSAQSATN